MRALGNGRGRDPADHVVEVGAVDGGDVGLGRHPFDAEVVALDDLVGPDVAGGDQHLDPRSRPTGTARRTATRPAAPGTCRPRIGPSVGGWARRPASAARPAPRADRGRATAAGWRERPPRPPRCPGAAGAASRCATRPNCPRRRSSLTLHGVDDDALHLVDWAIDHGRVDVEGREGAGER